MMQNVEPTGPHRFCASELGAKLARIREDSRGIEHLHYPHHCPDTVERFSLQDTGRRNNILLLLRMEDAIPGVLKGLEAVPKFRMLSRGEFDEFIKLLIPFHSIRTLS